MAIRKLVLRREVILIALSIFHSINSEANIAKFKIVTQSSYYHTNWEASNSVDGCLSSTSSCCAHTAQGKKMVWWRVNLGELMTINRITIYYRDRYQDRFGGYHLYLSNVTDTPTQGVLCYMDASTRKGDVQLTITHQCPYVARYVTVYNYRNNPKRYTWYSNDAILELCEVQVFGCQVGRYGPGNNDCNERCSEACYGGNCNPKTGSCFYCFTGKYGDDCENDCPVNCKGRLCEKDTGNCFECIPGTYGNTCDQNCSRNCNETLCEKDTGNCYECVPGKYGNMCDQNCSVNCRDICTQDTAHCAECIPGKYGNMCDQNCSVNCRDICTQDTAHCAECVPGKYGNMCDQNCSVNCRDICTQDTAHCAACVPTKRGDTCELDCPINCFNGICDKNTASCSSCVEGFYGTNCSMLCSSSCTECKQQSGECTKCKSGLHGMNCSMTCGNCSVCVIDTGVCVTECDPGYEGEFCRTRQAQMSDSSPPTTGVIVGPIVGVILAVVIGVVIAILIRRRRLRAGKQESFNDINHPDVHENNMYSEPLETENHNGRSELAEKNIYSNETAVKEDPSQDSGNVYINAEQVTRKSDSVYYNSGPVGFPLSSLESLVQTKLQNKAQAFEIEYKSIPSGALHAHNIGMQEQNKAKNRFKTTFPYDHSRVILDTHGKDPHSDYINANYIDSVTEAAEYIATQGPRRGTINDFWRMIWQLKSGKIVMLTNLIEGSRPKCDKYWPDEGEPLSTSHFNIILDRERSYAFYVLRDLSVTDKRTKSVRQIHQFHYTTWPDHGTPDPNELVVFHRRVKNYESLLTGKMVVHCSAGIGRTGTFLALDALLKYGKEFGRIDVMHYIKTMRKDRINMVQTVEQYIAVHQLLKEAFAMPDTLIPKMKYHTTLKALSNNAPTNQTQLRKEYQLTKSLQPKYDEIDCQAAILPSNKKKNRTLSVLAVDKFRPYLRSHTKDRTDYINAVLVPSYTSKTGYIVTQIPMEDTVLDLLTMIMDHNCQTIIVIETDAINWLPVEGEVKSFGDFTLEHKGKSSTMSNVDLLEIEIENENGFNASVRIFHLSGWNRDSSVPPDPSTFLHLLELVDSRRKSDDSKTTVVICRDGYSQSGLFCCISNARDQMKCDEEVDIFQISRQLLVRRPSFLINFEQYQCCYNMVKEYLDTTDVYMN